MFKVSNAFESWMARNCGSFYSDPVGMNSFAQLKQWRAKYGIDSPMPVYRPADEEIAQSIFQTREGWQGFQAWHDRRHLIHNKGFSLAGETFLAEQHFEELRREGVDKADALAVYFLIYGRNRFYHNNNQMTAENASAFVQEAFDCGVEWAARSR